MATALRRWNSWPSWRLTRRRPSWRSRPDRSPSSKAPGTNGSSSSRCGRAWSCASAWSTTRGMSAAQGEHLRQLNDELRQLQEHRATDRRSSESERQRRYLQLVNALTNLLEVRCTEVFGLGRRLVLRCRDPAAFRVRAREIVLHPGPAALVEHCAMQYRHAIRNRRRIEQNRLPFNGDFGPDRPTSLQGDAARNNSNDVWHRRAVDACSGEGLQTVNGSATVHHARTEQGVSSVLAPRALGDPHA